MMLLSWTIIAHDHSQGRRQQWPLLPPALAMIMHDGAIVDQHDGAIV